jgi:hypothetical protein
MSARALVTASSAFVNLATIHKDLLCKKTCQSRDWFSRIVWFDRLIAGCCRCLFYLSSPVKAVVGIATATLVAAAAGAEAVAAAGAAAAGAAAAGAAAAGAATAASSAILVISSNFFLRSAIMFSSFFSFACSFLISAYGDRNRQFLLVGVNSYLHAFNLLKMPPGFEVSHLNSVNAEHWLGAERQHQQGEAGQFHCDRSLGQQKRFLNTTHNSRKYFRILSVY